MLRAVKDCILGQTFFAGSFRERIGIAKHLIRVKIARLDAIAKSLVLRRTKLTKEIGRLETAELQRQKNVKILCMFTKKVEKDEKTMAKLCVQGDSHTGGVLQAAMEEDLTPVVDSFCKSLSTTSLKSYRESSSCLDILLTKIVQW